MIDDELIRRGEAVEALNALIHERNRDLKRARADFNRGGIDALRDGKYALRNIPKQDDICYHYAKNLLIVICEAVDPSKPVLPLDDTLGVLTQIDHMTAHLLREAGYVSARGEA